MQEKKASDLIVDTKLVLSFVKEQLSKAEASIRYAQLELEALTQTIQSLSMQKDMLVCKSLRKASKKEICTSGERQERGYQLTQDRVKIAQDFWESFKSEE